MNKHKKTDVRLNCTVPLLAVLMLISLVASTLADESERVSGITLCSGAMALGTSTASHATIAGQNLDLTPGPLYGHKRLFRVNANQETGIRVVGVTGSTFPGAPPGNIFNGLNNKGVAGGILLRITKPGTVGACSWYVDKNEGYLVEGAAEYAKIPGGTASLYLALSTILEKASSARAAADLAVSAWGVTNSSVIGPKRNETFAYTNFFISESPIKELEAKPVGISRVTRANELLEERDGTITSLYMFRIFRDHDKFEYDHTYDYDDRGNISTWCFGWRTNYSAVSEISSNNPDMLSIYWMNPHFPPISPYIPFFVGVDKVPPAFSETDENMSRVFQQLFNAVTYNMEYIDKIQKFWESFEYRTWTEYVQELKGLVNELIRENKIEEAQELLYGFTNKQCELAIKYAQLLTQEVLKASIIQTDISGPGN